MPAFVFGQEPRADGPLFVPSADAIHAASQSSDSTAPLTHAANHVSSPATLAVPGAVSVGQGCKPLTPAFAGTPGAKGALTHRSPPRSLHHPVHHQRHPRLDLCGSHFPNSPCRPVFPAGRLQQPAWRLHERHQRRQRRRRQRVARRRHLSEERLLRHQRGDKLDGIGQTGRLMGLVGWWAAL